MQLAAPNRRPLRLVVSMLGLFSLAGLAIAQVAASASLAPLGPLQALREGDLSRPISEPICTALVSNQEGQPILFVVDGDAVLARFEALRRLDGHEIQPPTWGWLIREGRKRLGAGHFEVRYSGQPHWLEQPELQGDRISLKVRLDVQETKQCRRASPSCRAYEGSSTSSVQRGLGDLAVRSSEHSQRIVIEETCDPKLYKYAGLFSFPSLWDRIAGFFIGGR